jgi:hypothetical protein
MSVKLNRVHVIVDRPVIARLMCVVIEIGHAIAPTLTKAKKLYDDSVGQQPTTATASTAKDATGTCEDGVAIAVVGNATGSASAQTTPKSDVAVTNWPARAKMLRSSSSGGLSAKYVILRFFFFIFFHFHFFLFIFLISFVHCIFLLSSFIPLLNFSG